ncbi:Neprilysin-1 [Nymphon striatum]|nr:Neprilysin-1 [Nymphon striatum]
MQNEFNIADAVINVIQGGTPAFLNVDVDFDMRNTSHYSVSISCLETSQFGLDVETLRNSTADEESENKMKAYEQLITAAVKILRNNTPGNDTQIGEDVRDIVDIESDLARMIQHGDDGGFYNERPIELEEFEDFLHVDKGMILDLLQKIAPNEKNILTEKTKIYVFPKVYVEHFFKLFSNYSTRAIANYIGWTIVRTNGLSTVNAYKDAYLEFENATTGVSALPARNQSCAEFLSTAYAYAVAGEYAKQYFHEPARKEVIEVLERILTVGLSSAHLRWTYWDCFRYRRLLQIKSMMDNVIAAFEVKLHEIKWMDNVTKAKAITKAKHVVEFIAYPEWTLSNEKVDKYYEQVMLSQSNKLSTFISKLKYFSRTYFQLGFYHSDDTVGDQFFLPAINKFNPFPEQGSCLV